MLQELTAFLKRYLTSNAAGGLALMLDTELPAGGQGLGPTSSRHERYNPAQGAAKLRLTPCYLFL